MKFADTSLLRIGYEEWNADAGRAIVLLHGWPDSPRCWRAVAPLLADAGYRVLAPALRGFAPTTFLRPTTPRTGQLAALGRDLVEFVHALGLDRPMLAGHDWGARAAANACGLESGIAGHLVMMSVGYGTNDPQQPMPLEQVRRYWYQWYLATPRGERTLREDRRAFARMMWDTWAPAFWYRPEEFEATALAWDNPDFADVVLHSYRHRWGFVSGDAHYSADDAALTPAPVLALPTLMLHGASDSCTLPESSAGKEAFFTGPYRRELLPGVGHFPPREAPQRVAQALLDFLYANPI